MEYYRDLSNRTAALISSVSSSNWHYYTRDTFVKRFIIYRDCYISPVIEYDEYYSIEVSLGSPLTIAVKTYTDPNAQPIIQQALDFIDAYRDDKDARNMSYIQEPTIKAEPTIVDCGSGMYHISINMRQEYADLDREWNIVPVVFNKDLQGYTDPNEALKYAKAHTSEYWAYFKKLYTTNHTAYDLFFDEHDFFTIDAIERFPGRVLEDQHPYDNSEPRELLKRKIEDLMGTVVDGMPDNVVEKFTPVIDAYLHDLAESDSTNPDF